MHLSTHYVTVDITHIKVMNARPKDSIFAITCFFNPGMYRNRLKNYIAFSKALQKADIPLLTVECAFLDQEYQLPKDDSIIQVRAPDVMWQKERLINLGLKHVPRSYTVIAWLDCDIIFHDESWPHKALSCLEAYNVIQLFSEVNRSEHDSLCQFKSFGNRKMADPSLSYHGNLVNHGQTGFAWAANRELLDRHGLYDLCLTGSGDHLMAHAFSGEINCPCVDERISVDTIHWNHFRQWAEAVFNETGGKVGAINGSITHLWHGSIRDRAYHKRNQEFRTFNFDPSSDVYLDVSHIWRWKTNKSALHEWASQYFIGRREDG